MFIDHQTLSTFYRFLIAVVILRCFYSPEVFADNQEIEFVHLTIDQGLSQNSVFAILQDHRGFLWLGTKYGLNRYDGYQFRAYHHSPKNPFSLSNDNIIALFEDRSGTLWIGTDNGGLNRYDREKDRFIAYRHDPADLNTIGSDAVRSICEDQDGQLWVGTENGGLSKFDPVNEHFIRYQNDPGNPNSLSDNSARTVYLDRNGTLWVGTNSVGLNRYDREYNRFIHYIHDPRNRNSISSNTIRTIYEDHTGALWIGTYGGGLNKFDQATNRFDRYLNDPANSGSVSSNVIRVITEDHQGNLWIGTLDGGLNRYDRKTDRFVHYTSDPSITSGLNNNDIWAIHEDRAGILWIGTNGGGLNKYYAAKSKFAHKKIPPDMDDTASSIIVKSIFKNDEVHTWLGTAGSGLYSYDSQNDRYVHYPNLSSKYIYALHQDQSGTLWIGTWGQGLDILVSPEKKGSSSKSINYQHDPDDYTTLANNFINSIYEDHAGTIWIGTAGGGLSMVNAHSTRNRDLTFTNFHHDPLDSTTVNSDFINTLFEDQAGRLWIGTNGGGLDRYDKDHHKFVHHEQHIDNSASISDDIIWTFCEDSSGILWIGTNRGLNKMIAGNSDDAPPSFESFNTADGLSGNVVYSILEDMNGHLWIGTNNGLSRFNPAEKTFRNYDQYDGLQSLEFSADASFKYQNSALFFGGINGFNIIHPEHLMDNDVIPNLVITDFNIFHTPVQIEKEYDNQVILKKSITESKEIHLSYMHNVFSLEYAALHFANPEKNQYAYIMEGFEKEWNQANNRRFASYTNLPAGKYTFRVKGSNLDGVWNKEGVALDIYITPPFWMTWWFRLIVVLLTLFIFIGFYRYRTINIRRHNRELKIEIDGRKKTEQELHQAKSYINNIINSMPSVLISIDASNRVTHWNEEAEKMTGIKKENATGQLLESVFPRIRNEMEKIKQSIQLKKIISEHKLEDISQDRSQYSDVTIFPLISNGTEGAVIRIDDITERIRLEEMMIQSEKMLTVGGLAAGMAHEINNPLAGMMQNAQVVLNRLTKAMPANEEAARASGTSIEAIRSYMERRKIIEMMEAIHSTGVRASKIVENMLGFSRKSESRFSTHDVIKILEDTLELAANDYDLKKKYDFRQIKIQREYATDVPQIVCERSNIQQVLLNILKNGAQAMTEEKIKDQRKKSKEKESCFTFRVRREDDMVRIEIEDNGPGMDEETRKRAFEPFFTTKSVNVGTGLGLSVSYFIITEQHKGKMSIQSAKGKGTKVIIHLNL